MSEGSEPVWRRVAAPRSGGAERFREAEVRSAGAERGRHPPEDRRRSRRLHGTADNILRTGQCLPILGELGQ